MRNVPFPWWNGCFCVLKQGGGLDDGWLEMRLLSESYDALVVREKTVSSSENVSA